MERIKQAISKAKASNSTARKAIASRHKINGHQNDLEQGKISYSDTQVVELDTRHLEANRIITFDSEDPDAVSFDILRTQVLSKMHENGWKTLAITSPTPECGKTLIALNLAISIAKQTDKTALVVDFDLRKPKVAEYMGLKVKNSLFDYLENGVEVKDILVNPGVPRLVMLPNLVPIRNSAETLTSPKVKSLVNDLRERYESRYIIFDLPPLMAGDDAIAFLPQVDCVLLVVAGNQTKPIEIKESRRQLQSSNLLGVVLNKSSDKHQTYY
jgi:protein-tyrosine kinase